MFGRQEVKSGISENNSIFLIKLAGELIEGSMGSGSLLSPAGPELLC